MHIEINFHHHKSLIPTILWLRETNIVLYFMYGWWITCVLYFLCLLNETSFYQKRFTQTTFKTQATPCHTTQKIVNEKQSSELNFQIKGNKRGAKQILKSEKIFQCCFKLVKVQALIPISGRPPVSHQLIGR